MTFSFLSKKQEYMKKWYQEHKEELLKKARTKRKRLRPPRQRKVCQNCGKLMKRIDYIKNLPIQIREASWTRRKYCSDLCSRRVAKESMGNYIAIQIHKDVKEKIMNLKYGKATISSVLKNLLENLRARHYGQEFIMGVQPTEVPIIVKVLCLRDIDKTGKLGEKKKGDTFITKYSEGDETGKFLGGNEKLRVVNILSVTKKGSRKI